MHIKGTIFDLDGTLLDSMRIWRTVAADYLLSLGIAPREDIHAVSKSMSVHQAAQYFQQAYGVKASADEIVSGVNSMIEHIYYDEAPLKKGVFAFLKKLSEMGVSMCVATATDRHLVEAALKRNAISNYFSDIFTCGAIGHGKDKPHIYEAALSHLCTKKCETLVFEDAIYAAETAKNAGFLVVGVFDASEPRQGILEALTDFYIRDFTEAEEKLL